MRRSILIVVQNLPVPLDRRVWLECQALRTAGYDVSVICPMGPDDPVFEVRDGVSLYKYAGPRPSSGLMSYLVEFVYCWLQTARLSVKVYRRHRFGILQACNPPDTFWALGALWRLLGVRYVFDQHDLNPELFRSRFGEPTSVGARLQLGVLLWLERRTYRTASHVIVTNESYRRIAMGRGDLVPADVTVVRSGPDTGRMRPVTADPVLRRGADHLLAYIGIMGPQDNVDVLLDVMNVLVNERDRRSVHLVLMGFGDCLVPLQRQCSAMGLDSHVTFTGRADANVIGDYLSAAHVGLSPDLKTPLNDVSTHNKTMEYMAYGLPVVSFDLAESRLSAEESSLYVESGDVHAFADAIITLLDDEERRVKMGRLARTRCTSELDWAPQARSYVSVFDRLEGVPSDVARGVRSTERRVASVPPRSAGGRVLVDLRDAEVFDDFLRTRGAAPVEVAEVATLPVAADLDELDLDFDASSEEEVSEDAVA